MKLELKGLLEKQQELINDILSSDSKYHIINASRQSSKSFTLSKLAIIYSLIDDDKILVVSPSYSQVQIIFDNIINTSGISYLVKNAKSSKPQEIHFKTGASIYFRSADRADFIRGGSYKYVFCDEFAYQKTDVFNKVIRPTTSAKQNSKIIVASTPNGVYNDFYDFYKLGISDDSNYRYYTMHYSDNIYYDLNEVEDARLRLPKNVFDQEYEAMFIDDGGDVFEAVDKVMIITEYEQYNKIDRYYAGMDYGSKRDSSVLTILNSKQNIVFQEAYSGDWNNQIYKMSETLKKYKPIAYGEVNSIGDVVISQLRKYYPNIREFITSNTSKREIVELLRMDIIKKTISLPVASLNKALNEQLLNYTFSLSASGLIRYHHRDEKIHDDYVDSLAIANYCYNKHTTSFKNLKQTRRSNFHNIKQGIH